MKFVKSNPNILENLPSVIDESGLNTLLSFKKMATVTGSEATDLINFLTALVFRATGQIFPKTNLVLTFDGSVTDTLYLPFRAESITQIDIDGESVPLSNFSIYEDKIVHLSGTFTEGNQNIVVTGNFGYNALPEGVRLALYHLIDSYYNATPLDRMQARASIVRVDKLSVVTDKSKFGGMTGSVEADRLLSDFRWKHSPFIRSRVRYSAL